MAPATVPPPELVTALWIGAGTKNGLAAAEERATLAELRELVRPKARGPELSLDELVVDSPVAGLTP